MKEGFSVEEEGGCQQRTGEGGGVGGYRDCGEGYSGEGGNVKVNLHKEVRGGGAAALYSIRTVALLTPSFSYHIPAFILFSSWC